MPVCVLFVCVRFFFPHSLPSVSLKCLTVFMSSEGEEQKPSKNERDVAGSPFGTDMIQYYVFIPLRFSYVLFIWPP